MNKTVEYQYRYVPISETITLEAQGYEEVSVEEHEEIHKRFAQHLAASMSNTKEIIASNLIWEMGDKPTEHYITEVDFK